MTPAVSAQDEDNDDDNDNDGHQESENVSSCLDNNGQHYEVNVGFTDPLNA